MTPSPANDENNEQITGKEGRDTSITWISSSEVERRTSLGLSPPDKKMSPRFLGRDDRTSSTMSSRSFRTWRNMSSCVVQQKAPSCILHTLGNEELIQAVGEHEKKLQRIKVENTVFEKFLDKNFPEFEPNDAQSVVTSRTFSRISGKASKAREEVVINVNQKSDIVFRDLEMLQAELETEKKKYSKIKNCLEAKFEELQDRMADLERAFKNFEQFRFANGPISLDKFTRHMNEKSKKFQLEADKIRLRYSSMRVQLQKLIGIYNEKQLIGENLQEIDFEQLRIQNVHLIDDIEKKRLLLLELKRMTGDGNLKLTQIKKILQQKEQEKELFASAIKKLEIDITQSDEVIRQMNCELQAVKERYSRIKFKTSKFKAPEVMEYVMKKKDVYDLNRALKTLTRKKAIKEMALKVHLAHMKNIFWTQKVHACWFE